MPRCKAASARTSSSASTKPRASRRRSLRYLAERFLAFAGRSGAVGDTQHKSGLSGLGSVLNTILDRLEEWIIATLIGAATILTFIAVVHRYGASNSAGFARWAGAHGFVLLQHAADGIYTSLAAIDLSWAQELATYMFVWMAKFGAALGVRTGIHVGVDIFVNRLVPAARKPVIIFALL